MTRQMNESLIKSMADAEKLRRDIYNVIDPLTALSTSKLAIDQAVDRIMAIVAKATKET